ncbi:MAG TPA: glycosyltransferase [Jatrophihabitans sp.]|nr:glycosyltransferase [Jatrophihabitans sp.]
MTVTACLIVRDCEAGLPDCLASVRPFVDELVVLDTGSVDGTRAVAAAAGAEVHQAHWTDDFAAARNAALARCTGDWVLSIDADELATGVPGWLAPMLAACGTELDALSLLIRHADGPDARGLSGHREVKLFRRDRVRWAGRVHERPVRLTGGEPVIAALPEQTLHLVHTGYTDPELVRAKAERNARLCRLQLDELTRRPAEPEELARAALDLGRSELAAGRPEEALVALRLARDGAVGGPVWSWATDFLVRLAIEQQRTDEATWLVAELFRSGAPAGYCRWLLALTLIARGARAEADRLLADIAELTDLAGNPLDSEQLRRARAACAA